MGMTREIVERLDRNRLAEQPFATRSLSFRCTAQMIEATAALGSKNVWDLVAQAFGNDHPEVAKTLQQMAKIYHSQAKFDQAEPLYKRALEIREKCFGHQNPEVASTLNNLGKLYSDQGRFEQALPIFLKSKLIVSELFGPEHPKVATRLAHLAKLYAAMGNESKAASCNERLAEIRGKSLALNAC